MQEFLKELFEAYYSSVYSYLYSLSRDPALSEDLASEVLVEAVKSIGKFHGDSDIKTWLFSIARHRWFAHLRKQKAWPQTESIDDLVITAPGTPETLYMNKELSQRIQALLDEEPERTRAIVRMRLDGYSFHEIGAAFGISENSARVIDYRAKTKIRKKLEQEGFGNE